MSLLSQSNRSLGIKTALGDSALFVERISGKESLGNAFEYTVSVVAENDEFSYDDLLGTDITVRMEIRREGAPPTRFFNGIVSEISHHGYDQQGNSKYDLRVVSWNWFLTQGSDCKIFQDKNVPDILEEIFSLVGVANYEINLQGSYPLREYCVQYRESHYNFVQRLMQHEGIYYYWKQEDGKHTMVLCDNMSQHLAIPGFEQIKYRSHASAVIEEEYISSWKSKQMITPGSFTHNSFNFKSPIPSPNQKLLSKDDLQHNHKLGEFEVYDNPADFLDTKEGERLAVIRREEVQTETKTITSSANARGLYPGGTFQPTETPRTDQQDKNYLITSINFQASTNGFGSGTGNEEEGFTCSFKAIPKDSCVFRPARVAEIPKMQGVQTAMVSGPSGEEIYVDKFGRVKVQFHWDRNGQYNAGSSCWVRVSQAWAGPKFGSMNIPRIGQEVIVDFVEGNPDHPIITGRVYNGENIPNSSNAGREGNSPPADLTKAAMMTSFKSSSLGKTGGSNEITMNDASGSEGLFLKAQKDEIHAVGNDRKDTVGNNETIDIGVDRTETVGNNETITIGTDRIEEVGNNETITIGTNRVEEVGSNETITIGTDRTETVGNNETITIGTDRTESVGSNETITIGSNQKITIGANQTIFVQGNRTQAVKANKTTEVGGNNKLSIVGNHEVAVNGKTELLSKLDIDIVSNTKIVIAAPISIELQAGSSSITIGPKGITLQGAPLVDIQGPMVKLN